MLEQEREPATLARPRRLDALDPMVGAGGARHLGGDGAMVLEEIQMPPGKLGKIMDLARPGAVGAGKQRAAFGGEFDVQLLGPLARVEPLSDQLLWWRIP